jgi:cytidine deaminase
MKPLKPVIVHLFSIAITGYIAFRVASYVQFYKWLASTEFYEVLLWTGIFLGAIIFVVTIWLVDRIISYLLFLRSSERGVCGLYVEAFSDGATRSNLSLMVVYYDVARDELKITGYSYHQDGSDKTKIIPWANWESRGVHHTVYRNYVDVFYIHDGDVEEPTHDKVRGTTICRFPTSHRFFQTGRFWDLKTTSQTGVRPMEFELIKADESTQKSFFDGIKGLGVRPWCLLKLAAPTQEHFLSFTATHGKELLDPAKGLRGPMMLDVWQTWSGSKTSPVTVGEPANGAAAPQQMTDIATAGSEKVIRDRLSALLQNSFAPYSDFRVAAAVVDEGNSVYYGVNIENQSFSVATCAEAGAIAAMRLAGGKEIKKLYLLSEPNIAVVPCGACRQRLAEFGDADTQVTTFRKDGHQSSFRLEELFPHSFRFK